MGKKITFLTQISKTLSLSAILFLMLSACTEKSTGKRKGSVLSSTTDDTPSAPTLQELFWYSPPTSTQILTINSNINTKIYLRGSSIHSFLGTGTNFSKIYCVVMNFATPLKQLRLRAIPIQFTNTSNQTQEKLFRIDSDLPAESQTACTGTAVSLTGSSVVVGSATFDPETVSTALSGTINSTGVQIHESTGTAISTALPATGTASFNVSTLGFIINITQSSGGGPTLSTCTDSQCQLSGFDCCSEGQCVNAGTLKPNASNLPDYATAIAAVLQNPSSYVFFTDIYYSCPTGTTGSGSGSGSGTTTTLTERVEDYLCLMCDSTSGRNPSHPDCLAYTFSICQHNGTNSLYSEALDRAKIFCDCHDTFVSGYCDGLSYSASYATNGTISSVTCAPLPIIGNTPSFQALDIFLNMRSVPHRFFNAGGSSVDFVENIQNSTSASDLQEGSAFLYYDVTPINGRFNMNSILGSMDLSLTKTLPSQVINVIAGETYVVASASNAVFNPCILCTPDSWFSAFKANPSSSYGKGLQATGFSTDRMNFAGNITGGNYEDTHFGRACYIPPSMIPFSHSNTTGTSPWATALQYQRQARLYTQAALFTNGYQKDWFGFNKGALIGSFDGISWFAIGTGRIIQATSSKLFLAINAPFGDLTQDNNLNVHITTYTGVESGATSDYDPSLPDNHPNQNQAGTCQKYHQCTKDTDCIAQLGWEYVCANVADQKTLWPDIDMNTVTEETSLTPVNIPKRITDLLSGFTGSNKRCVYRGAGAPCRVDYENFTTANKRRIYGCAANFHCAAVTSQSFNYEIARYIDIETGNNSYRFGMATPYLGRPAEYLVLNPNAMNELPQSVQDNLTTNAQNLGTDAFSAVGLCRPGKKIDTVDLKSTGQHGTAASNDVTDYISQIGACDPDQGHDDAGTGSKLWGCPIVNSSGNLRHYESATDLLTSNYNGDNDFVFLRTQNNCGKASTNSLGVSAFENIEALLLGSGNYPQDPTLVLNGCLRRAGSVCHSDLDCSPNALHSERASGISVSFFGGTLAEQKYWEENLICGQSKLQTADDYELKDNRCCRAVGQTLTMYSDTDPSTDSPSLHVDTYSILNASGTANRYSRYEAIGELLSNSHSSTYTSTRYGIPENIFSNTTSTSSPSSIKYQWRTFQKTGQLTCCGSGFVRNFENGGHNWVNAPRFNYALDNFRCLNYRSKYAFESPTMGGFTSSTVGGAGEYNQDRLSFSFDADIGGGAQALFNTSGSGSNAVEPTEMSAGGLQTVTWADPVNDFIHLNLSDLAPFLPQSVVDISGGNEYFPWFDSADLLTYINVPSYLQPISGCVAGAMDLSTWNAQANCFDLTLPQENAACNSTGLTVELLNGNYFNSQGYVLRLIRSGVCNFARTSITASFIGYATQDDQNNITLGYDNIGANPGNYLYYLYKLERFELLGIPQISYEPIYCNWDKDELLPDLFSVDTRSQFQSTGWIRSELSDGFTDNYTVTADEVNHDAIFSSEEFSCCIKLGQETNNPALCCSGYAKTSALNTSQELCALPSKTDLHVYFNRFVSSEGVGSTEPGGGFSDTDFNADTGAPKATNNVNSKIYAMGAKYCENGSLFSASPVYPRYGGVFGDFIVEPAPNPSLTRFFSIADSSADTGVDNLGDSTGSQAYANKFRWNNHIYCR
ncbi:MAG: hypothetical protein KBD63_00080 [Bacteriovoracaceae bacterium]|nr:hypothetical protein [Bacteriovoracaceae bacterium]